MSPLSKPVTLTVVLSLASLLLAAYEFMLTRAASIYYFFDIAYLVLALCLLSMAVGALAARPQLHRLNVYWLCGLQLATSVLIWPALNHFHFAWVTGLFSVPFLLFGALAALVWHHLDHWSGRTRLYAAELIAAVCGLALLGPALLQLMPLNVNSNHGVQTHLKRLIAEEGLVSHVSAPSAWAQTDLIETTRADIRYVFTDGMFVTRAVAWNGRDHTFADADVEAMATLKRLVFAAAEPGRVALLGAGAGFDIAVALQMGATDIDVVEINPATIAFARSLDEWAGGVMSHPSVRVIEDDARRFVERQDTLYNHINITLIETAPANARARHHIAARILTAEAIKVYLQKLQPGGVLSIIQNTDAIAASTAQLLQQAVPDTTTVLRISLTDADKNPFRHLFLVGQLDAERQAQLKQLVSGLGASYHTLPTDNTMNAAVTDNRPFFFEQGTAFQTQSAFIAAFCMVLIAVMMVRQRHSPTTVKTQFAAVIAGAIALSFQLLAVYHVQSVVGLPGLALAAALTAVLGGAGLGALLWRSHNLTFNVAGATSAAAVAAFTLLAPEVTHFVHQLPQLNANIMMIALTTLCSLPIGLPFLAAMREASAHKNRGEAVVIGFDGLGGLLGVSAGMTVILFSGYLALGICTAVMLLVFACLSPTRAT